MQETAQKNQTETKVNDFEVFVKRRLPAFKFDMLTEILGISKRMLTAYFNDPIKMTLPTFFKFAETLDMSYTELEDIINPKEETK